MDKQKEYLISIFVKKATAYYYTISSLEKTFELLRSLYPNITSREVEELRKKFTIEKYIERITPTIDELFSEEEIKEVIKFYTKAPGNKLFDIEFLKKIQNAGTGLFEDIEKEFKDINDRKNNT